MLAVRLERPRHQDRGQEPVVDEHRPEHGPQAARGASGVETRDHSDRGVPEGPDDAAEVALVDPHVAVGDDQEVVFRRTVHVGEVTDLEVGADHPVVHDEGKVAPRQVAHDPLRDRDRGVLRVAHPEDDLKLGVVLLAEGAEVLVEPRFRAPERLEHGDGRPGGGPRPLPGERADPGEGEDRVREGEEASREQKRGKDRKPRPEHGLC